MTIDCIGVNLLNKAEFSRLLFLIDVIRGLRFRISGMPRHCWRVGTQSVSLKLELLVNQNFERESDSLKKNLRQRRWKHEHGAQARTNRGTN